MYQPFQDAASATSHHSRQCLEPIVNILSGLKTPRILLRHAWPGAEPHQHQHIDGLRITHGDDLMMEASTEKNFTELSKTNLSRRTSVAFACFQKGLSFLRTRSFHTPFLGPSDEHGCVISLYFRFSQHGEA
jgi:hypothetical protein